MSGTEAKGTGTEGIQNGETASRKEPLNLGSGRDSHAESSAVTPEVSPEESVDYNMVWLDLSRRVIEEKKTKLEAIALEMGMLPNLKTLFLHNNAGDFGMRAMLKAMRDGHLEELKELILWNVSSYDEITAYEQGTDTIAIALRRKMMKKLETLDMTSCLQKLIPARSWTTVVSDLIKGNTRRGRVHRWKKLISECFSISSQNSPALECLYCQPCKMNVYSGDAGVEKVMVALSKSQLPLRSLHLRDNYIGVDGAKSVARILRTGGLPKLEKLDLQNNPVGLEGAREIVLSYLENPLLTTKVMLDWPDPILKLRASAFREKNIILEHKLKSLQGVKMEHDGIFKDYKWRLNFSLERHPSSTSKSFWLRLLCQGHNQRIVSIQGIEIRTKSFFRRPSGKIVETDPPQGPPETRIPFEVTSAEESDEESTQVQINGQQSEVIGHQSSPQQSNILPEPRFNPATFFSGTEHSSHVDADRDAGKSQSNGKAEEGRMHITARSRGFIKAAILMSRKLEENEGPKQKQEKDEKQKLEENESQKRTQAEKDEKRKPKPNKAERQMNAIIMELLMVAHRKPREFFEMFGLSRVLLPAQEREGYYYPAYVCDNCKSRLKARDINQPIQFLLNQSHRLSRPICQDRAKND
ncbi:hypothetical protein R1flu_014714 [Riccia fluitans]|uniref:Uncharacterized protein n=1 Tax=Riccia fluitans TaxID=41844 RepID=A0ABD1YH51_9MARC